MNYKNLGFAKTIVANVVGSNVLAENFNLTKDNETLSKFVSLLESSEILEKEFEIFNLIENKQIDSDVIASRYIDKAISVFENYTKEEIQKEREKLVEFIDESFVLIPSDKKNLYESLSDLILQTAKGGETDIDLIHESFINVLNYLKTNKKSDEKIFETVEGFTSKDIVDIAINNFNEEYSFLDENEIDIVKTLAMGDRSKKVAMFESLKDDTLKKLDNLKKRGYTSEKLNESIEKINSMVVNEDTIVEDTIKIYSLKTSL
jgi:hypothetical protein